MLSQVIEALHIQPGSWYVDATFGRGGHTQAVLEAGGKVIALDQDQMAIEYGQNHFPDEIKNQRLMLIRSNFDQLEVVIEKLKTSGQVDEIKGILFDFGASTDQLMSQDRGFSFTSQAPLDMRMDDRLQVKAMDLLAALSAQELTHVFLDFGGEKHARPIAQAIVRERRRIPFTTCDQLATFISKLKRGQPGKLHPATKVFQALRIAVNSELDAIEAALPQAYKILASDGHLVTIAFHEGEDRLVKTFLKQLHQKQLGDLLTKKPITPDQTELQTNHKARSAKLRVFHKTAS